MGIKKLSMIYYVIKTTHIDTTPYYITDKQEELLDFLIENQVINIQMVKSKLNFTLGISWVSEDFIKRL